MDPYLMLELPEFCRLFMENVQSLGRHTFNEPDFDAVF